MKSKILLKKWYWLCQNCGDEFYPNTNKEKIVGITVLQGGKCRYCQRKLKDNEYLKFRK